MNSSERKTGIAGNRATRRRVNLTRVNMRTNLLARPPRPALTTQKPLQNVKNVSHRNRSKSRSRSQSRSQSRNQSRSQSRSQSRNKSTKSNRPAEREIHGLTIPQIAWLKQNDSDDYDAFLASLTDAEFQEVMELDMFGDFNVKY